MTLYTTVFLLLLIVLIVALYTTAPVLLGEYSDRPKRNIFLLVHSLLLTVVTILFLNQPDAITSNQEHMISLLNRHDDQEVKKAEHYLKDNFLLINTAYDKELIPYKGPDSGPESTQSVTNRKHLADFLSWCAENASAIDLVVCDIGFYTSHPADLELKTAFNKLIALKKLLISNSGEKGVIIEDLPEDAKGMVSETVKDDRFNTHQIYRSGRYSLAYKIYCRLDSLWSTNGNSLLLWECRTGFLNPLRMNSFLPVFYIVNQNFHKVDEKENNSEIAKKYVGFSIGHSRLFHNLESLAEDPLQKMIFLADLNLRKDKKLKNVLFVGSFEGDEDEHRTIFGTLHGPVILLNLVYNLHEGQNQIGWKLFVILFLGFWIITWMLLGGVKNSFHKKTIPKVFNKDLNKWLRRKERKNKHLLDFILSFLKDHMYWFFLAILILVIYITCGVMVNIACLILYFLTFRAILITLIKHHKIKILETNKNYL